MTIKLGTIFKCSWGYDQTNIDFYQVVRVISEKTITVRQIASKQANDSDWHVVPLPNNFISGPFNRRPRKSTWNDSVYINGEESYMSASIWDGEPCYETSPGYGH